MKKLEVVRTYLVGMARIARRLVRTIKEEGRDERMEEQRLEEADPLVDVLRRTLGNLTGRLLVADAFLAAGIEPSKATQFQITRVGHAIRTLGWERQRRLLGKERAYVYVRGSEAEREIALNVEIDHLTRAVKISPMNHGSN